MVGDNRGWSIGLLVQIVVALVLLGVTALVAFAAWPIGMWVGWRVASGSWVLPELAGDPIAVWRIVVGVLAGALVVRFGRLLRSRLVMAWRDEWGRVG